jgi:hypothetical protein
MLSFDFPQLCTQCQGYKTMPYSWSSTAQPKMCSCPKPKSLAWECPRCKKINAPWKASCDCTPSPLNNGPTCGTQPNKYLADEMGQWDFRHASKVSWDNIYKQKDEM